MFAAACNWSSTEQPQPEPLPPVPEIEPAWVQASLLRLRVAPNPDSAFTPLPINTRVRVVKREGEWVRIVSPDGRAGWVHRDFLGQAPLDPAEVQQKAEAATDPAEKVVWAERSAALSPADSGKLTALVGAYRAAGREEDAAKVEEMLKLDESERFDRWFAGYTDDATAVTDALEHVDSGEQLIVLWQKARDLTAAMGEPLARGYDDVNKVFPDGDPTTMLADRMPWAMVALYADGTVPALELAPAAWTAAAAKTPDAWDDAFLTLVTNAYESASARGWATWQKRTWDYGGCSPFGSGANLHLGLLKQTDALADVAPVAPVVAEIRAGVLGDIVEKGADSVFPYCVTPGQPTPIEGLLAEAQAILAEVKLTPEERARLEARITDSFGRSTAAQ